MQRLQISHYSSIICLQTSMNRFSIDQNVRPEMYIESALQSLGRITSTLNRKALKHDVSPTKLRTQSSQSKYQLDENTLCNIIQETQRCQKILSQIIHSNAPSDLNSKHSTSKVRNNRIQNKQNDQQAIVNQVIQKLANSGYIQKPPNNPLKQKLVQSPNQKQSSDRNVDLLVEKLNLLANQNQQLKRKLQVTQDLLVQKSINGMNEQIQSIVLGQSNEFMRQIANLKMEKAKMNEQFQKQIMKYNHVFKKLKSQNDIIKQNNCTKTAIQELIIQNQKLRNEKEQDQKTIEDLRTRVLFKHHQIRNVSKTMSKLSFNIEK